MNPRYWLESKRPIAFDLYCKLRHGHNRKSINTTKIDTGWRWMCFYRFWLIFLENSRTYWTIYGGPHWLVRLDVLIFWISHENVPDRLKYRICMDALTNSKKLLLKLSGSFSYQMIIVNTILRGYYCGYGWWNFFLWSLRTI